MNETNRKLLIRIGRLDCICACTLLDPGVPKQLTGARAAEIEHRRELLKLQAVQLSVGESTGGNE